MTIRVTKTDIKNGLYCSNNCPVALAIIRKTKYPANVHKDTISFYEDSGFLIQKASPKCVVDFVEKFDSKKPVKPFSFTLK